MLTPIQLLRHRVARDRSSPPVDLQAAGEAVHPVFSVPDPRMWRLYNVQVARLTPDSVV